MLDDTVFSGTATKSDVRPYSSRADFHVRLGHADGSAQVRVRDGSPVRSLRRKTIDHNIRHPDIQDLPGVVCAVRNSLT